MPKVIEGVKENILSYVKELISSGETITIEKIAKHTGIAKGTVFNYFPSKEMILASVILEDWLPIFEQEFPIGEEGLDLFFDELKKFREKYEHVWASASGSDIRAQLKERHSPLRDQVVSVLRRILPNLEEELYPLHAEMILILAKDKSLSYSIWKSAILSL